MQFGIFSVSDVTRNLRVPKSLSVGVSASGGSFSGSRSPDDCHTPTMRNRVSGTHRLALVVEGLEYDRVHATFAYEFERVTTQVRACARHSTRVDVSERRRKS